MNLLPLLQILSDGKFHSGDEIGKALGVSRAAIWKTLQNARKTGVDIHSVRGKGYRLNQKLELIDRASLLKEINGKKISSLQHLDILLSVDSTNNLVLRKLQEASLILEPGKVYICLAEQQTAGKGRRGRQWLSPFGCNMYFSLVKEFDSGAVGLEGLSLVVAIAVIRALGKCGINGLTVKWPNDVLWQNRKLGGILLEMTGDVAGICQVVIGIGLNINASSEQMQELDQPWVNVETIAGAPVGRNRIIGQVIGQLLEILQQFEKKGFAGFREEWERLDAFRDCQIEVSNAGGDQQRISGISRGVADNGALLLETEQGMRLFNGGEVSMRRTG